VDLETSAAIESLGAGTARLGVELRAEMADLSLELRGEMSELGANLRAEMADLRVELRAEMAELRAELRDGLAENRRHSQVLFESLHDDIRILAGSVASIVTRLDARGW